MTKCAHIHMYDTIFGRLMVTFYGQADTTVYSKCGYKNVVVGFLSKTSQIIFDLHPGFSHMEDEKGNKLHLFKKYFKMMFFTIQAIIGPYCYSF